MSLGEELDRIAAVARAFAEPGEELVGILAAEPGAGERVYLCAYAGDESRTWLALDADGSPVRDRGTVREAVSIAALCEVAGESAAGGDLDELRSQLVALRLTENPEGIEEAEAAALALQHAVGSPPRVAKPAYLDDVGAATRRLEHALGDGAMSPFAEMLKAAVPAVDALAGEVESNYKRELV